MSFGSQIDTVTRGGRFDGILGCVAAIECPHREFDERAAVQAEANSARQ
jgi:hypothetical protein